MKKINKHSRRTIIFNDDEKRYAESFTNKNAYYSFGSHVAYVFISSCSEPKDEQVYKPDPEWSQDQSSDMNQVFAAEENDEIELYVKDMKIGM